MSTAIPTERLDTSSRPPRRPTHHWQRAAALTGAVAALLLTPIQSLVYNGASAPATMRALRPLLEPARSLAERLGTDDLYHLYGRLFAVVYLGALAGLAALRAHHSPRRGALHIMTAALILATALDVVAYSDAVTSDLPFMTEVAAVTVALIAGAVHGRHLLRTRIRPGWIGWMFIAAVPAALIALVATQYLPHAVVLPLSLALAAATLHQPRDA